MNCKITGDAPENSFYLGRPWRPYGKSVFIICELGKHIKPEGWDNWRNPENEKTAFFAEYNNSGAGAEKANRVPWSHQLSAQEAEEYKLIKILGEWSVNPKLFQQ
jgi:pectinesterase